MVDFPTEIDLKDGRKAVIDFVSRGDNVEELQQFANSFVDESAMVRYDTKFTHKATEKFIENQISAKIKKDGYTMIVKVGGMIAGTTSATREKDKARHNVSLSIAIAKPYRGVGLGKALLNHNIECAKELLEPKNIFLNVQKHNEWAVNLYEKMGFKEFAVFPEWVLQDGKFVDRVFMKLER